MKATDIFTYKRTCTRCRRSMPMHGAITHPKFVCSECRARSERRRLEKSRSQASGSAA